MVLKTNSPKFTTISLYYGFIILYSRFYNRVSHHLNFSIGLVQVCELHKRFLKKTVTNYEFIKKSTEPIEMLPVIRNIVLGSDFFSTCKATCNVTQL